MDIIEELGHLTKLRVLELDIRFSADWNKLVGCLHKLQNIQLSIHSQGERNMGGLDDWVGPRHLRILDTMYGCWFSTLPAWINPSHLLDLSVLHIAVRELRQGDLETLGRLPALRGLGLMVGHEDHGIHGRFIVGAGLFPCLVRFWLSGFLGPVVFQQGAMPRLTILHFPFHVWETREIAGIDGAFDLGLGNLASLQHVYIHFQSGGASKEVEEAKAALSHAAEIHPNHPTLQIYE
uniref:Disease resistance R13L4/SHOC-2-like LRR domain-containing protein n=1 Tax=Arundo donax TaxID=35708 RepID=A0A0A9C6X5_ARUDO